MNMNIASQGDAIGLMAWWNDGIMGSEVDVGSKKLRYLLIKAFVI